MKNEKIEEIRERFYQYMEDGYGGGKEGLRCSECDSRYRGTADIVQLCPMCMAKKTKDESYEKGIQDAALQKVDELDVPYFMKAYETVIRKQLLGEIMEEIKVKTTYEKIAGGGEYSAGYNDAIEIIKSKY